MKAAYPAKLANSQMECQKQKNGTQSICVTTTVSQISKLIV